MAISTIGDDQVLALVRQLPGERKAWLLRALGSEVTDWTSGGTQQTPQGKRIP
jgi:hypothetical protein